MPKVGSYDHYMDEQFFNLDKNVDIGNFVNRTATLLGGMPYPNNAPSDLDLQLDYSSHGAPNSQSTLDEITAFQDSLVDLPDGGWQFADPQHLQRDQRYLPGIDEFTTQATSVIQNGLPIPADTTSMIDVLKNELDTQASSQLNNSEEKSKKTKHSCLASEPVQARKRTRRTRGKYAEDAAGQLSEDRRNKFLERNRLAASKCRQKKKEWSNDLEDQARRLQGEKDGLSSLANLLKEEILWLKGEMLKHSTCDCTQVRSYLKEQVGTIAKANHRSCYNCRDSHDPESPLHHRKQSMASSTSVFSDEPFSGSSVVFSEAAGSGTRHPSPITSPRAISEPELETLLASNLTHDTSDEGIARQIQQGISKSRESL